MKDKRYILQLDELLVEILGALHVGAMSTVGVLNSPNSRTASPQQLAGNAPVPLASNMEYASHNPGVQCLRARDPTIVLRGSN